MRDFRNIKAWEKAHQLNLEIYKHTELFPKEEKYGLISQVRRPSTSIATNIAEGCGHNSIKEFSRYINISVASCSETEYLLILSKDLKYIEKKAAEELISLVVEVRKMLNGLLKSNYNSLKK